VVGNSKRRADPFQLKQAVHEANKIFKTDRRETKRDGDYGIARERWTKLLHDFLHEEKYNIEVLNVNSD